MDAQTLEFYGESAKRIKDEKSADAAVRQFNIAARAESDNVRERALNMAAISETKAFAG